MNHVIFFAALQVGLFACGFIVGRRWTAGKILMKANEHLLRCDALEADWKRNMENVWKMQGEVASMIARLERAEEHKT